MPPVVSDVSPRTAKAGHEAGRLPPSPFPHCDHVDAPLLASDFSYVDVANAVDCGMYFDAAGAESSLFGLMVDPGAHHLRQFRKIIHDDRLLPPRLLNFRISVLPQ